MERPSWDSLRVTSLVEPAEICWGRASASGTYTYIVSVVTPLTWNATVEWGQLTILKNYSFADF